MVSFGTAEDAERLASGVAVGQELRAGVTVLSTRVFEVSASA